VEISGCGATVEIEVDDEDASLDTVAVKARELWREARTESRAGGPGFGFTGPVAAPRGRDWRRLAAEPMRGGSGHQDRERDPAGQQDNAEQG
jgi:hypothetical protein